jgi:hypothetical protein
MYRNGIPTPGSSYLNILKSPSSSSLDEEEEECLLPLYSFHLELATVISLVCWSTLQASTISKVGLMMFAAGMMI